jgi:hypothetical protein
VMSPLNRSAFRKEMPRRRTSILLKYSKVSSQVGVQGLRLEIIGRPTKAPGSCAPIKQCRGVLHCSYDENRHRCIGYSPLFSGGRMLVGSALCLRDRTDARHPVHSSQSIEFGHARKIGTYFGGLFCVLTVT